MEVFTQTSDVLYDRHHYKVVFKGGKEIYCESWESANQMWFQWLEMKAIDRIEVLDKPIKKYEPKGF